MAALLENKDIMIDQTYLKHELQPFLRCLAVSTRKCTRAARKCQVSSKKYDHFNKEHAKACLWRTLMQLLRHHDIPYMLSLGNSMILCSCQTLFFLICYRNIFPPHKNRLPVAANQCTTHKKKKPTKLNKHLRSLNLGSAFLIKRHYVIMISVTWFFLRFHR